MANKDEAAFKTIGEVSQLLDVPQHVLRFWESKFPILSPQKRRGRRYYDPEDVAMLKKIYTMLYEEGYTIKGVGNFLEKNASGQNERNTNESLVNNLRNIEASLRKVANKLSTVLANDQ
jgi:DNA-binding transcriptional MerR regulator